MSEYNCVVATTNQDLRNGWALLIPFTTGWRGDLARPLRDLHALLSTGQAFGALSVTRWPVLTPLQFHTRDVPVVYSPAKRALPSGSLWFRPHPDWNLEDPFNPPVQRQWAHFWLEYL